MNNTNKKLSSILDIEPIEKSIELCTDLSEIETNDNSLSEINEDSEYARSNIKKLIQTGGKAIDQLLYIAEESEQPRAYEVIAALIKNIGDLNKDLLEIQKRKKDLYPKETKNDKPNISVNQGVIFSGSTTEFIKLLKETKTDIK